MYAKSTHLSKKPVNIVFHANPVLLIETWSGINIRSGINILVGIFGK